MVVLSPFRARFEPVLSHLLDKTKYVGIFIMILFESEFHASSGTLTDGVYWAFLILRQSVTTHMNFIEYSKSFFRVT